MDRTLNRTSHDWIPESNLQTLSQISRALWAHPERSNVVAKDTLAAVTLLRLDSQTTLRRTITALLNLARSEGQNTSTPSAELLPFYRLNPEERFLLAALHTAGLDIPETARMMGLNAEDIGRRAWLARRTLAHMAGIPYPTGTPHRGPHCPDYSPQNPWTQRFLDEEIQGTERLFLQNHLMACARCRAALTTCRNLYYQLDGLIPRLKGQGQLQASVDGLRKVVDKTLNIVRPGALGVWPSVRAFLLRHRDVQIAAGLFLAVVVWKILH